MQDSETNLQETETPTDGKFQLEAMKEYSRLTLKRLVAVICFGPGVLGFLWLISRILRR
jgi:hypothetical protein